MVPVGSNYCVVLIAAFGVVTADPAFAEPVVDHIYAAVQRRPSVKRIPSSTGEFAYYALEIENLCGPGSLTQAAMDWVDDATFPGYQRCIALSVTYAFPDSFPRLANVTIPLNAIANTGDRGVQNCAPISVRAQRDWNDVVRDVINAYPAFWENMPRSCPTLSNTLSPAAHSDPISIALGLYYHAAANSDSYNLATNRTCLSSQEFRQLSRRGWPRLFENALSFQNAPLPEPLQQVAARALH